MEVPPAPQGVRWTIWPLALAAVLLALTLIPQATAPAPYFSNDGGAQKYRWIDDTDTSYHSKPAWGWTAASTANNWPATYTANLYLGGGCSSLPFNFTYYGTSYSCAHIHENGFLRLNSSAGGAMPTAALPGGGQPLTIGGYWTDLSWGVGPACGAQPIYTSTSGTAPNRVFTIEWRGFQVIPDPLSAPFINFAANGCNNLNGNVNCTFNNQPCTWVTFQIQLYEGSNNIEVRMQDVHPTPQVAKASAIGIVDSPAAPLGLGYDFSAAPSPSGMTYANRVVRFFPNHPPQPQAVTVNVTEDTGASPAFALNATDLDNDQFRLCISTAVSTGTLTTSIPTCASVPTPPGTAAGLTGPNTATFTPNANVCGAATFGYKGIDELGQLGPEETVTIDVACLNDPPTFTRGAVCLATVIANVNAPTTLGSCAVGVAAGPAAATDEANQAITFPRTSMSPDLFTGGVAPTLTRNATDPTRAILTFMGTGTGSSTVCFKALDDNLKVDGVTAYLDPSEQQGSAPSTATPYPCITIQLNPAGPPPPVDSDGDGLLDGNDNCAATPNSNQANKDGDLFGDVCDADIDGDTVANLTDNCPLDANGDQADNDGDNLGDACDTPPPYACGPVPFAGYTVSTTNVLVGQQLTFSDATIGTQPTHWTWDFGDGVTGNGPSTSHAYASQGTYTLMLTVSEHPDCRGGIASGAITVIPLGIPQDRYSGGGRGLSPEAAAGTGGPVADAGADAGVTEGTTVRLHGSVLGDHGLGLGYAWRLVEAPAGFVLGATGSQDIEFKAPQLAHAGGTARVVLELRVTQDGRVSAPDEVVVTVVPGNKAPVARAGSASEALRGSLARLDGTASSDPEGKPITFVWSFAGGEGVALQGADAPTPSFMVPSTMGEGFADFRLTVSDGRWTSTDTVRVWFREPARPHVGFTATPVPGDALSVAFLPDRQASSYAWDFGDGQTGNVRDPVHTYAAPGTYVVQLTVIGVDGSEAVAVQTVTVDEPGRARTAGAVAGMPNIWPLVAVLVGVAVAGFGTLLVVRRLRDA